MIKYESVVKDLSAFSDALRDQILDECCELCLRKMWDKWTTNLLFGLFYDQNNRPFCDRRVAAAAHVARWWHIWSIWYFLLVLPVDPDRDTWFHIFFHFFLPKVMCIVPRELFMRAPQVSGIYKSISGEMVLYYIGSTSETWLHWKLAFLCTSQKTCDIRDSSRLVSPC